MLAKVQLINLSKESINPGSSEQQFFLFGNQYFLSWNKITKNKNIAKERQRDKMHRKTENNSKPYTNKEKRTEWQKNRETWNKITQRS